MKIVQPKPFTFKAGNRAVLLLHAFTGHSADVRMLGRFLQKQGYTSHAPIYRGHGLTPEALLKTSPSDWWEDVEQAYLYLRNLGYEEIAVAGLSLGGVLGLKLASKLETKGIITMATPMYFDNESKLLRALVAFSKQYKQLEGKDEALITQELGMIKEEAPSLIKQLDPLITKTKDNLSLVEKPALIIQPVKDQLINPSSATYIYNHILSPDKDLLWYEKSLHVVTTGVEKDRLHKDVYQFLQSLAWTN